MQNLNGGDARGVEAFSPTTGTIWRAGHDPAGWI